MKERIFITAYDNPDLDSIACMYAYREFLNKKGESAVFGIYGVPAEEASTLLKWLKIWPIQNGGLKQEDKVVLVDSYTAPRVVAASQLIERIDHHDLTLSNQPEGMVSQVELVGAAATLIAERFYREKIEISKESAALLYYAIISNTINFHSGVTTERDKGMAEWLKNKFNYDPVLESRLHKAKSLLAVPLPEVLENELAIREIGGKKLGITQLEIVNTSEFVRENLETIKRMLKQKRDGKGADFALGTFIDIEKYCNRFVVADKESRVLAERVLGVRFRNDVARREGVLLRKEIWPLVKEVLEK